MPISKECELCGVDDEPVTKHHLKPKINRNTAPRGPICRLCALCHAQVHRLFTNKDLRDKLSTINKLKRTNAIQKWLEFRNGGIK